MRIGILHHDLEFAEEKIVKVFKKKGHDSYLIDIRNAKLDDFDSTDMVLNRVYASVANRDYSSIKKTLKLLKKLEKNGIKCINSYKTSVFDYNKYLSSIKMYESGIKNPKTILINKNESIQKISKYIHNELGFPIIIKRNTGGRGKDISRVSTINEIKKDLKEKYRISKKEGYNGDFIAQEFVKTIKNHDCRIGVINYTALFSYGRSLIKSNSDDNWLASMSNGSKKINYEAKENEKKLAEKATKLIDAQFNELDIMFTKDGPSIIENNPTPNYFDSPAGNKKIEFFINKILKNEK